MKVVFSAVMVLLMVSQSWSQDLHYSYYHFTPLTVNPANAGAFSGSYRVGGIYTAKDGAISDRSFRNFSLTADAPIVRGIRKQDWIGIGVQADVMNALNGSGDLSEATLSNPDNNFAQNWTFIKISAAYHLALDKKQTNILTIGAQLNNGNRTIPGFNADDTRNGIINRIDADLIKLKEIAQGNNAGGGGNQDAVLRARDMGAGLLFNARRKKSDLRLGFALEGLLNPRIGILSNSVGQNAVSKDSVDTKPIGLNIHGDYRYDLNKRTSIEPSFYYYSLGPFSAFNINSHAWYQFNEDKDLKGGVGLGTRSFRDVMLYLGARFSTYQVGVSYDLNVNDRTIGSNGLGGLEIAVRYIGTIYKKPKVKPVIFCPRL
jgi:type IX secretion system PorP/SprF family membrane protein